MQKSNQNSRKVIIAAVVFLAGGCCCQLCKDGDRLLRHVVLFEFKETATAEQIEETETRFREMAMGMKEVFDFEWGTDVSGSDRAQGFTHCFILTFTSKANLDKYKTDPVHNELRAATQPYIKNMLVIDYWKRK
ncbi:MAG: Dabb family protein [Sedimentisphaerales bacterium]|nr:Dabb family protein [Sedimentisphaerales bacterium]